MPTSQSPAASARASAGSLGPTSHTHFGTTSRPPAHTDLPEHVDPPLSLADAAGYWRSGIRAMWPEFACMPIRQLWIERSLERNLGSDRKALDADRVGLGLEMQSGWIGDAQVVVHDDIV